MHVKRFQVHDVCSTERDIVEWFPVTSTVILQIFGVVNFGGQQFYRI